MNQYEALLRQFLVALIGTVLANTGWAQFDCGGIVPEIIPHAQDCSPGSTAWNDIYRHQDSYIVGEPLAPGLTKSIKIAVHIWQDDFGGNNFVDDLATIDFIEAAIEDLDGGMWTYNDATSDIIPGVPFIADTKLRVDYQGLFFHQNTAMNGIILSGSVSQLSAQAIAEDPEMEKCLLLHFVCPTCHYEVLCVPVPGIAGVSNGTSFGSFGSNHYVVSKGGWGLDGDWQLAQHWAHEIGHNLKLCHTYW